MRRIVGVLLMIFLVVLTSSSQDKPKKVEDKEALLTLQLLATKRALVQSNYASVIKQANELQAQYTQISNELNSKVDALYAKLGLDKTKFDINFETGEVSPLASPAATK